MKIAVERFDWKAHAPDLVILVGDSIQDFHGPLPEAIQSKVQDLKAGFEEGRFRREVFFSVQWGDGGPSTDVVYFHTSTEKGHPTTETLKTFFARGLKAASETGRRRVALLLKGRDGEGLLEQLVEGAVVGTYSFRDFLKDSKDPFESVEVLLCPPTPPAVETSDDGMTVPAELEGSDVGADDSEEIDSAEETESRPAAEAEPTPSTLAEDTQEVPLKATEPLNLEATETDSSTDSSAQDEEGTAVDSEDPEAEDPEAGGAAVEEAAAEEGSATEGEEPEESHMDIEETDSQEDSAAEELSEPGSLEEPAEREPSYDEDLVEAFRVRDESALAVGRSFGEGVNLARTLSAQPASVCTPGYLAKQAQKIARSYGMSFQAFGPKELESHRFVGHIAVGGGAAHPPVMVEMTYQPEEDSSVHLVLLGKGVTFDTGGISIKPSKKMHLMIGDMSGAAAVLGAMQVIGQLKPKVKVTGLIVAAENSPDGKSYRPGDILKYKNGISVHVENTDAEGRLLLADGLIRAGELQATHIVDIATLTGACPRALGPSFTGILGVNRKLINAISRAGGEHGESYWRLPLPLEYREMLKTPHADLNNVGGEYAGTTTAGLFLKEFVPPRTTWAHLDIASTFWREKPWRYYGEGPTGVGVKTLADLALRWEEHLS